MGIDGPKGYWEMSFSDMMKDSVAGPVLQDEALQYVRTRGSINHFDQRFTGELDRDGYLIPKSETGDHVKPSEFVDPDGREEVARRVTEILMAKGLE